MALSLHPWPMQPLILNHTDIGGEKNETTTMYKM